MRLNVKFQEQNDTFKGLQESDERLGINFGTVNTRTENDYSHLINKPRINNIPLEGNISSEVLGIEVSFPSEGSVGDILMKTSDADDGVSWITPASNVEQDNTRPITSAAVYTEIGNISSLLATI